MSTDHTDTVLAGRYRLFRRLGRGGFAEVWLARDLEFPKREVAVKILHPKFTADPINVRRFTDEAKIAGSIHDPNDHIVKVTDFGTSHGHYFLVMEFLEGPTLREELKSRRPGVFECAEALHIVSQICDGLAVAARKYGVAHRDLKPENIFLAARRTDVHVKIVDLGIAKVVHEQELAGLHRKMPTAELIGTPIYMAPELTRQMIGEEFPADIYFQADVYSLGVILYEMLTGAPPFEGPDAEVLRLHLATMPLTPREARPALEIPNAVETLVMRCLTKAPQQRYKDAGALGREIRRLLIEVLRDHRYTSINERGEDETEPGRSLTRSAVIDPDAITEERRERVGNVVPFRVTRPVPTAEDDLYAPEEGAPIVFSRKSQRPPRRIEPVVGPVEEASRRAIRSATAVQVIAEVEPAREPASVSGEIYVPPPITRAASARHAVVEVPAVTQIVVEGPLWAPPIPFFIKVVLLVLSMTALLSMAGMGYALYEVARAKAMDEAPVPGGEMPIGDWSRPQQQSKALPIAAVSDSRAAREDDAAEMVETLRPRPSKGLTSAKVEEAAPRLPSAEGTKSTPSVLPKGRRTMKGMADKVAQDIKRECRLGKVSKATEAAQEVRFDIDTTTGAFKVTVPKPVLFDVECIRRHASKVSFDGVDDLQPIYEHTYTVIK